MLRLEDRIENFEVMMQKYLPTEFMDWLKNNGFFTAPASKNHHGNYEGGLFDHCYAVAEQLKLLTKANRLKWENPRSPFVVGMFHDLCKIDEYVKVVDEEGQVMMGTGEVKGEIAHFEHASDVLLKGHGDKSIMLLSQFITLTEEEILCIRYHMGAYNRDDWEGFDKAIRKYPNVLFTHTADMYASKVLEL